MNLRLLLLLLLIGYSAFSQEPSSNYRTKKVAVKDSIVIDSVSINSSRFVLKRKDQTVIDSTYYRIDFVQSKLFLLQPVETDSLIIEYLRYPDFLTKTYKQLDNSIIVENTKDLDKLYKLSQSNKTQTYTPFDGLVTSGSISRGVTIGNNQNSVLK